MKKEEKKWKGFADVEKSLDDWQKPQLNKIDDFKLLLSKGNNKKKFYTTIISIVVIIAISLWVALLTIPSMSRTPINAYTRDHNSGTYEVFVKSALNGDGEFGDDEPFFNEYVRTSDNNTQIVSNVDRYVDSIGYSSAATVELYDNVRTLDFYISPTDPKVATLTDWTQVGTTDEYINATHTYIKAYDTDGDGSVISSGKLDENDTFVVSPTTEAIENGFYKLSRNFHIVWMGSDFFDMSDPSTDIYDTDTWPTVDLSNQNEVDEAVSFAFFAYITFSDSDLHQDGLEKAGLFSKPASLTDSELESELWPVTPLSSEDIRGWLEDNGLVNNPSAPEATVRIQGSASTTYAMEKLSQNFRSEMGISFVLDQGNSVGSSSAFNSNEGTYIGTQSRNVKDSEVEKGAQVKSDNGTPGDHSDDTYYNYFSFGTDALEIIINEKVDSTVTWITPEILRDIYIKPGGSTWGEIIGVYYA